MNRRLLTIIACLTLAAVMSGCGSASKSDSKDAKSKVETSSSDDAELDESEDVSSEDGSSDDTGVDSIELSSVTDTVMFDNGVNDSSSRFQVEVNVSIPDLTPPEIPDVDEWFGGDDDYRTSDDSRPSSDSSISEAVAYAPVAFNAITIDGMRYTLPMKLSDLKLPYGWEESSFSDGNFKQYSTDNYGFAVFNVEVDNDGNITNIMLHSNYEDLVPMSISGGLTWGASMEDVEAVFGETDISHYNGDERTLWYRTNDFELQLIFNEDIEGLSTVSVSTR